MGLRTDWAAAGWGIGCLLVWGLTALGETGPSAPTAALSQFIHAPVVEAWIYIVAALLALYGYQEKVRREIGVWLCLPSFLLICAAGESSMQAVAQGQYPDGTVRPLLWILRDQCPLLLGEMAYSTALFGFGPLRVME
jgi:hypothetical protein